jgi:hypothetical protein
VMPHGIVSVTADAAVPKEDGPGFGFRLKFQMRRLKDGSVSCELLAVRKASDDWIWGSSNQALEIGLKRLRAQLGPKGRAALGREQEGWQKWCDAQPIKGRDDLMMRRGAELLSRAEK